MSDYMTDAQSAAARRKVPARQSDPTPAAGAPETKGLREALIVAWSNGLNAIEHWRLGEEFADAVLGDPSVATALATAPEPSLLDAVEALPFRRGITPQPHHGEVSGDVLDRAAVLALIESRSTSREAGLDADLREGHRE